MTRYGLTTDGPQRSTWRSLGGVARALGDAVATPRGAAPDRAVSAAALRRERF